MGSAKGAARDPNKAFEQVTDQSYPGATPQLLGVSIESEYADAA